MAQVLVVYHRPRFGDWRSTYESHRTSFRRFSSHDVYYLNTDDRVVPRYLTEMQPDLVIYHYTFLAYRVVPAWFASLVRKVEFTKAWTCAKAIIPHDEQVHGDLLSSFCVDYGITHVFTPASAPARPLIYDGVDLERVQFHTVLTGYVDDASVKRVARRAKRAGGRSIDIGYRCWGSGAFYGRHGLLKWDIGRAFQERAPAYGLSTDISSDYRDAFFGDRWFDFLLRCKYTLGVEGGSGVLDRDGSIAVCVRAYVRDHTDASFEEIEAACFPGLDGQFTYRLLGPRHFEAAMTRTCQVLIEGSYGGALEAGRHYIPLKRDFSNIDEVLEIMREDEVRAEMVERAYQEVIASGRFSYSAFADLVFAATLGERQGNGNASARTNSLTLIRNRAAEYVWLFQSESAWSNLAMRVKTRLKPLLVRLLGEERVEESVSSLRRMRGRQ